MSKGNSKLPEGVDSTNYVKIEGSFAGLLILSGIPKGIAAGATIIIRFCTLWFGVVVGLITIFIIKDKIS